MSEPQEDLAPAEGLKVSTPSSLVEPASSDSPMSPGLAAIYEILGQEFKTDKHDLAERHNEHQP
ncbi:hypothetical protein BH10PLA2_BH10PLA2_18160 [soil metagenome]